MIVKVIKDTLRNVINTFQPDAVLEVRYSDRPESELCYLQRDENAPYQSVIISVPKYIDGKHDEFETLSAAYHRALIMASNHGIRTIAVKPVYGDIPNASFSEIYRILVDSAYDVASEVETPTRVLLVLDLVGQGRFKALFYTDRKQPEVRPAPASSNQLSENSLGFLFQKDGDSHYIPDDIHNGLKKTNMNPLFGMDDDAESVPKLLKNYLDNVSGMSMNAIVKAVQCCITKSTVYNYFDENYSHRLNKAPLFYICLAMGMSYHEAVSTLEAATHSLDKDNSIDFMYIGALKHRASVAELLTWLDLEGLLVYERKSEGLNFKYYDEG